MLFQRFRLFLFILVSIFSLNSFCITSPNVNATALFLYRNSNFHKEDANPANLDTNPNGLAIQEAELQFYSAVDPYTRLNLLLAVHPSLESKGTKIEEKWIIEPEEAFADISALPATGLKIGKFKASMGKHNTLHTHTFTFVEAPLTNTRLLGDEGLNDVGISAAVLLPTSWFSEFTLQYLRGKGENEQFNSPNPNDGVGVTHWKNLFEIDDTTTVEIGGSYASGINSYRKITSLKGADITLKWRPTEGGKYRSVMWAAEYLARTQRQADLDDEVAGGLASWIQYQFALQWVALYRYDYLTFKNSFDTTIEPNETSTRHSVGLVYSASEFSALKLEFNQRKGGIRNANNDDTENTLFMQFNLTMGAHPTHTY